TERRIKRSCLRDLAHMLRSFDYASAAATTGVVPGVIPAADSTLDLEFWVGLWRHWVSATYLRAYMAEQGTAALLPKSESELKMLLDVFQIEAALHEIMRTLDRRPEHLSVPVRALLNMLD
ncbi:MAG TPA: hypothetical protein VLB44_03135, partial [Kofleriaceae bacterium]|nr:hypothetical protein [Kofleriaceae bacterium]